MNLRSLVALLTLLVVLGSVNASIVEKETIVREGESILLELAPVDPRSLMQGDYMVLRYALARAAPNTDKLPQSGLMVISPDENRVASFVRYHDGSELAPGEYLLAYKHHKGQWRDNLSFGARDFFFEEGAGDIYSEASYGELRVSDSGESVLIGLRDENFDILGQRVLAADAAGLLID